jgi:hypothetical protein
VGLADLAPAGAFAEIDLMNLNELIERIGLTYSVVFAGMALGVVVFALTRSPSRREKDRASSDR